MGSTGPRVGVSGLSVEYGHGPVLRHVSFSAEHAGSVAIVGPSGSGKTTLLYAMAGLETPSAGTVTLLGERLAGMSQSQICDLRLRHVGFVFQQADLVPELTVADNIALPLELVGVGRRLVRRRVGELVDRLGLKECALRRPHEISGGQAQRAAIGRAAANRPEVIFADEPTGALDSANGLEVMRLLDEQVRHDNALLVMVTHDTDLAAGFDQRVHLRDGEIESIDGSL